MYIPAKEQKQIPFARYNLARFDILRIAVPPVKFFGRSLVLLYGQTGGLSMAKGRKTVPFLSQPCPAAVPAAFGRIFFAFSRKPLNFAVRRGILIGEKAGG